GTSDWAVARLTEPVPGVAPYQVAGASRSMTLVAQGHSNWRARTKSIETCSTRSRGAEIQIDCDTGQGASGAAFLVPGTRRIFGLFVGFRSAQPNRAAPYDPRSHHNYGVAIRGALAAAIRRLAR
ncbi:MAG: serine protease, partial [Pseudomonadota bacterium]